MSLRARVAVLVVIAFSTVLLVVGLVIPALVRDYLLARLDDQLEDARFLAPGVVFTNRPDSGGPGRGPNATFAGAYVEVRTKAGVLEVGQFVDPEASAGLRGPDLPAQLPLDRVDHPFTIGSSGGGDVEWRVLVVDSPRAPGAFPASGTDAAGFEVGLVTVALPTTSIESTVDQIVRIEWIAGAVSAVVLAAAAWFLVGVGLGPLRRMERSAAAISGADQLDQRVEHPSPRTELGRLGATLNGMLGRLQHSFDAQQLSEARLRRFVSDASHELRTPLTSIRGYAELYRRGGDRPEQVERSMARIEDEALRMTRLVDDLLALARLDERAPIEKSPVDLRVLVERLVADARVVSPDRSFQLSGAESCIVDVDRFQMTQAVANLIANARVHTPAGTPVEIAIQQGPADVTISVIDHGPGLPDGAVPQVFDRFYRADPSRSRQQGGAGLGLAITAAIVQAHGGTITFQATAGGGATFVISIPTGAVSRS